MGKRILDVVGSGLGLIILIPVLLLIAIAIKLDSRGPVFFRQERMGHGFRPFRIVKFRTMVIDASGPLITAQGDERVTGTGRFLRRWKLDELPQLWNVFTGDMSLVGPRPEVRKYVEMFPDDYREVLKVRPGITDPASIAYRREDQLLADTDDPESKYLSEILPAKIAMAKEYVKTQSCWGDLKLIFRTIAHV